MFPPRRLTSLCFTVLASFALQVRGEAQTPATGATTTTVAPAAPSPWDLSGDIRASGGWRENVAVSSVHSVDRAFWRTEAEGFALGSFGDHWRLISFVSGDVLRYFDPPPGIPGEQEWLADVELRWQPAAAFRGTLKAVGFLDDTFIDPAETEGELLPAIWVRLQGGYVLAAPRLNLPYGFAIEPSLQVKRVDYKRGYAGDNSEARPGVRVEWNKFSAFTLSAAWYEHERHYQHLIANKLSGRLMPDHRLLGVRQQEAELKAITTWHAHGTWTLTATANELRNRDRAVGFLDYDQRRGRVELQWENTGWRATLGGDWRHLNYRNQTVGIGLQTAARTTSVTEVTLRLERELSRRWTVFTALQRERDRSNIPDDLSYRFSYRTAMLSTGIQRNF
jgi:hypothetical protein